MPNSQFQRSFEQSLRSSYISASVVKTSVITPVKKEIHRGCTGKAHACGTLKTIKHTPVIDRTFRKGSFSSDTVSDTSSEVSQQNATDQQSQSLPVDNKPPLRKLRLFSSFRRKTADAIHPPTDNNHNLTSFKIRDRVQNEEHNNFESAPDVNAQTNIQVRTNSQKHNKLQHSQSFHLHNRRSSDSPGSPLLTPRSKALLASAGNNDTHSNGSGSSKINGTQLKSAVQRRSSNPVDSAQYHAGCKFSSISTSTPTTNGTCTATVNSSVGGFYRGLRNSFRHKQNVVQWSNVWEQSFSSKPDGGTYKSYTKLASSKVK